ncbi:M24 family metallopeptidase [Massilia sp. CCM 8733]|uniref:M24 family metallopeptidase n=1 Tax=Massilia mucilaginosa TaxID=2609282 RepID=A0ABX0NRR7_9BURK|nr:Xaa-Pro peptidase family protein [Massilia mucilaginosa]NHZ89598.1 M24 family metallopeptidase [Massilia mucilaginosa]
MNIGKKSWQQALDELSLMTEHAIPIGMEEHLARMKSAQRFMVSQDIDALYLNAGSNLTYFTGMQWHPSERMVGAILPAAGELVYIAPAFERGTIEKFRVVPGDIVCWDEHDNPALTFRQVLEKLGISNSSAPARRLYIDESTPLFLFSSIQAATEGYALRPASPLTSFCRARKSAAEIALIQCAMNMTLQVQRAAASILHEGITTKEVEEFIHLAHKRVGSSGSYFCIVLFGEATAYPHGVNYVQTLKQGDMVLIDTGCKLYHYLSDITRTYVFGEASERQRFVWDAEKAAQQAAFDAAQLGVPCEEVDKAARRSLEAHGFGPGYALPGLPHRTGHGIGLDIHEGPYLVGGETRALEQGMCFSNEPMICVPGEFGVRLEDHFYMSASGPRWFTRPAASLDQPFA